MEVRYAGHADAAIVAFLRGRGRGWRVATDDRELGRRARAEGAEVVGAAAFWERVARAAEAEGADEARDAGAAEASFRGVADTTERLPDAPARVRARKPRRRSPGGVQ